MFLGGAGEGKCRISFLAISNSYLIKILINDFYLNTTIDGFNFLGVIKIKRTGMGKKYSIWIIAKKNMIRARIPLDQGGGKTVLKNQFTPYITDLSRPMDFPSGTPRMPCLRRIPE